MQKLGSSTQAAKQRWEASFEEQIAWQAYNTAPVEAVVRTVSYYLRERVPVGGLEQLHFLEMGCGAGSNLVWLAQKGVRVSAVDISPTALRLARAHLQRAGCSRRIGNLVEASVSAVPFGNASFNGIIEACVFQHLAKEERQQAFREVKRLLKPGGIFVGYMLDVGHSVFQAKQTEHLADDPGTVMLADGRSKVYLTNIGLAHFYTKQELIELLSGFSVVNPCSTIYDLPQEEARRRGYVEYRQSMWTVYAIK